MPNNTTKTNNLRTIAVAAFAMVMALFAGCGKLSLYSSKKGEVLASVGEKDLYFSEVEHLLTNEMSREDSLEVIDAVRSAWVRTQLKLQAAEVALSGNEKDIEEMVNEYRTSLMIYKYESDFVGKMLDTTVTDQQIIDYYNENKDMFRLAGPIVKARIARIPAGLKQSKKLEDLFYSNAEDNVLDFMNIAEKNNYRTYDFTYQWVDFNTVLRYIPLPQTDLDEFLKSRKNYDVEDSQYKYLMKIESFRITGDYSPQEKETETIRKILLNKRRAELLKALDDSLYNKAAREHRIIIK